MFIQKYDELEILSLEYKKKCEFLSGEVSIVNEKLSELETINVSIANDDSILKYYIQEYYNLDICEEMRHI